MSLTPGVSTMVSWFSSSAAGWVSSTWWNVAPLPSPLPCWACPSTVSQSASAAPAIALRAPSSPTNVAVARGPYITCASTAVVGVMPVGMTGAPRSALMNVDLPWLNSPRTTIVKRSSSSLGSRVSRTSRATDGSPAASAAVARSASTPRMAALRSSSDVHAVFGAVT